MTTLRTKLERSHAEWQEVLVHRMAEGASALSFADARTFDHYISAKAAWERSKVRR
jgi:hypothetical protein